MSILQHNGAAIIAWPARTVAIAPTAALASSSTVAGDVEKGFKRSDRMFVGLAGLATDVQTLRNTLKFKLALYELREERVMKPEAFSALLSHMLYEKRFGPYFVEPVVCGLKDDGSPFLCGMDLIGAPVYTDVTSCRARAPNLNGMCESAWRPDMAPDRRRDGLQCCLVDEPSGWGTVVHGATGCAESPRRGLSAHKGIDGVPFVRPSGRAR